MSLGWKDPLEKEMATYSSNRAWEIPWTEELAGLQSLGSQELDGIFQARVLEWGAIAFSVNLPVKWL